MNTKHSFARALLADPRQVGAVTPSSPRLAELITREITADSAPVIEFGPGTGVFTQALLDRGIAPEQLALVEASAPFAVQLRAHFPNVRVIEGDASELTDPIFDAGTVGAIVSGIPLLPMKSVKVKAILAFAFGQLRPGGAMFQFTYGPQPPIKPETLAGLGLRAVRVGSILRNLPPATVFRIERIASSCD